MGFGTAPRQCEIHSKPQPLLQKNCIFHTFEPKLRMQDCAYVRILWPIYTGFYPRMWAEGYFGLLFSKIDFCAFNIFHFNTPQVNLVSNWALN